MSGFIITDPHGHEWKIINTELQLSARQSISGQWWAIRPREVGDEFAEWNLYVYEGEPSPNPGWEGPPVRRLTAYTMEDAFTTAHLIDGGGL